MTKNITQVNNDYPRTYKKMNLYEKHQTLYTLRGSFNKKRKKLLFIKDLACYEN